MEDPKLENGKKSDFKNVQKIYIHSKIYFIVSILFGVIFVQLEKI